MINVYTDDQGNTYTILQLCKKVLKNMKDFGTLTIREGEHFNETGTPSVELIQEDGNSVLIFNYMKGTKGDTGEQGPEGRTTLYRHELTLQVENSGTVKCILITTSSHSLANITGNVLVTELNFNNHVSFRTALGRDIISYETVVNTSKMRITTVAPNPMFVNQILTEVLSDDIVAI